MSRDTSRGVSRDTSRQSVDQKTIRVQLASFMKTTEHEISARWSLVVRRALR